MSPQSSTTPLVDVEEVRKAAMHSAAERAKLRRQQEEEDREKEKERGGYSFDVSCHSDVELKWESNRELVVAYTGSDNDAGISVYQKPSSEDRAVRIKYVAKQ